MGSNVTLESKKQKDTDIPTIRVSGAGVLHARSSEILKSTGAKKQIKALKKMKAMKENKGRMHPI